MDEKEIRKILKEETVIPDNIDKAMEDVLKGILDSPDERMSSTKNLIVKSDKGRSKNSGNKKKIIRILLPVAAVLGVSTGVLATKLGWLHKELEQQVPPLPKTFDGWGGHATGVRSNLKFLRGERNRSPFRLLWKRPIHRKKLRPLPYLNTFHPPIPAASLMNAPL